MQRILVLRGGALGDFLVTLPALAMLRDRWPQSRIEIVGNAMAAVLALNRGLVDAAHSQHEARWAGLHSELPVNSPLREWLGSFDHVLNYWPDPEGDLAGHFPIRDGQIFLSTAALPAREPAAVHYCAPLVELGLAAPEVLVHPLAPLPNVATTHGARGAVVRPPTRTETDIIAIHPGSGSRSKNWPIDRWIELCAAVERERLGDLLVITGEADTAAAAALAAPGRRHAHQLSLEQLIAELTAARLFIGHDSGISHLAAACGLHSILLFGPTDPAMWAPPVPHVQVIRRGTDLSGIPVGEVASLVREIPRRRDSTTA